MCQSSTETWSCPKDHMVLQVSLSYDLDEVQSQGHQQPGEKQRSRAPPRDGKRPIELQQNSELEPGRVGSLSGYSCVTHLRAQKKFDSRFTCAGSRKQEVQVKPDQLFGSSAALGLLRLELLLGSVRPGSADTEA
ncbi:hypothetical protein FQA47_015528 [Oryzias melastigma]|uniref:Uncharacterized protein n=1 Tax=Oryzias melastigma TaxID=30732 RepID=A0A834L084_ORYME|nr:hypothetical protein FQA47_015528 [Oryzias melastigma]